MNRSTRSSGFSLVEIMVGMVIGLIGIIIIMQVFAVSEGQKRTTTSGADAQTNGNIALYTIERDARQAGYGMSLNGLGCQIGTSYGGNTTTVLEPPLIPAGKMVLAPVIIADGGVDGSGNALPDSLRLFYSTNAMTGMPELLINSHPQTAAAASLNSNLTVADHKNDAIGNSIPNTGDMVVFYEAGKNCALAQVTPPPPPPLPNPTTDFNHDGTSPWNTNNTAVFPVGGYNPNATLYNFGAMTHRIYSIDAAVNQQYYNLQALEVSSIGPAATVTTPLAGEIVNLQAQYGKDTNNDGIVDTWNTVTPAVIAPAGAGLTSDWTQIIALRIAILARSGQYEKPTTAGVCTATTASPSWVGGTMAVPGGLPSCYRYKVFETVVPLRNIIWG